MSLFDSALAFIEGIKSVIDVSGTVQSTITDAISNGINSAFRKIKKPLEMSLMKVSFMFVSVFFIVWGAALFIDNFVPYQGLGFAIAGSFFGIISLFFLQEKDSD